MNETKTKQTYVIPRYKMYHVEERMLDLRAKAKKLNLSITLGFNILREFTTNKQRFDAWGLPYTETEDWTEIQVYGEAPVLQGWSLMGRFDYKAIPGQVMRAMVPGVECPTAFADCPSTRCDACGHKRARNDTFLLRHEDGRQVVVGRSCLKDYLGHVSPEHIAQMASILCEVGSLGNEEGEFWGSRESQCWDIRATLKVSAYAIRVYGWASTKEEHSTKECVLDLLTPSRDPRTEDERLAELKNVTAGDINKADLCLEWMRKTPDSSSSDYLHNLHALSQSCSTPKSMGLAVSAVIAYSRVAEQERSRTQQAATSNYVGTIKERKEWDVTVVLVRGWETAYGYTTFLKMQDAWGNVLTWKASRAPDVNTGDHVRLVGTVKAHDTYKDVKQTVLTRCKILEVKECAA